MCLTTWLLVRLLRRAAREMSATGEAPYLGEFDTCAALGRFIEQCSEELRRGDRNSLQRLWFIFAPTCDWDDAGGSQDVGNLVFGILGRIARPPALDQPTQDPTARQR